MTLQSTRQKPKSNGTEFSPFSEENARLVDKQTSYSSKSTTNLEKKDTDGGIQDTQASSVNIEQTSPSYAPIITKNLQSQDKSGNYNKLAIDLCAGLAGFSRAFVEAGWEVITIDNDWKFKPTIVSDVTRLTSKEIEAKTKLGSFGKYEKVVVVVSPPCERFSLANSIWPQVGIRKGLEQVGACLELILAIKPDYWCLENPAGRLRWFLKKPTHSVKLSDYGYKYTLIGGKVRRNFKKTDLWGNIPFALVEAEKIVRPRMGEPFPDKSRIAEMPSGLSKAVLEAVTRREAPLAEVE